MRNSLRNDVKGRLCFILQNKCADVTIGGGRPLIMIPTNPERISNMKGTAIFILLIGLFPITIAQTDREKADELKDQAIELMDGGKIDESIKLLKQAQQIDPDYIHIPYEIAFAYQLKKDYDKSIEVAKPLLKHPDVFDQVYQLIGNCYDLKGDKAKALKSYDKGIKKFPNSGKLYLEKGVVFASEEKWFEALEQ
jgi:tetratricopeptide (TPR) repeat protein